jgi:hypothetical protein
MITTPGAFSAAVGRSPMLGASLPHNVLLPCISLRALEGFMSSCLRNALKMRITEHFPNSPQFTFSAFSLGCQAFVVIFINSNGWLLPFLSRKTPPPVETGPLPTAEGHRVQFAPVSPGQPLLCNPSDPSSAKPTLSVTCVLSMLPQSFSPVPVAPLFT